MYTSVHTHSINALPEARQRTELHGYSVNLYCQTLRLAFEDTKMNLDFW